MKILKKGLQNREDYISQSDKCVDISFFILLCTIFANNSNQKGQNYVYYFGFFLFVGLAFIKLLIQINANGTFVLPTMTLWYAVFTLLGFASMLWAAYPNLCMHTMSRSVQCLVITFFMAQNYSSKKSLTRCLKIISWTGFFSIVYILVKTPMSNWFIGAFGRDATKLNSNSIGMIFTICTIISFYFAYSCSLKKYYFFTVLQLAAVVLTSSRKSLLCVAFAIMLLVMLNTRRRHYFLRIIVFAGSIVLLFYLIMKVPQLYSAIGRRIETMMTYFTTQSGDRSIMLRRLFIEYARELFFNHAILGIGLNNFAPYIAQIMNENTYAHNNYYEILADLGIVGFVSYYSYYVYMLACLVKILRNNSTAGKLMFTILASIMICEYGLVSFSSLYMQIFLCCVSMFISAYYNDAQPAVIKVGEKTEILKEQVI